jgi:hypothetical protein
MEEKWQELQRFQEKQKKLIFSYALIWMGAGMPN